MESRSEHSDDRSGARPQEEPQEGEDITLADLTERLGRLAGRPVGPEDALRQLADLEVASEELRVVEEEVRVQQEQLAVLLRRYEAEHHWRSRLSSLVPVGLCLTDSAGKVLDANPALAAQLQVGMHRLRGKPLSVFLDPEDVPGFRSALRALTRDPGSTHRATITLRGRRAQSRAELFGFPESPIRVGTGARVQWVLVPEFRELEPEALAHDPDAPVPPSADAGPALGGDDALRVATALSELSSVPVAEPDPQRQLTVIAGLVSHAVPAAPWISVTLGSPLAPERVGSDAAEAQDFDGRQVRAQEGPCQEAYATGMAVLSADVTADARWPVLAQLAGASPVRSVLAVPVRESTDSGGVLNMYSPDRDAFRPGSRRVAGLVAAAVSGALQSAAEQRSLQRLADHLEAALSSRAVIDQAKGVLMASLGLTADEAFARLVTLSNRLNVKVRDLAVLVTEGHLDALIHEAG